MDGGGRQRHKEIERGGRRSLVTETSGVWGSNSSSGCLMVLARISFNIWTETAMISLSFVFGQKTSNTSPCFTHQNPPCSKRLRAMIEQREQTNL